MSRLPALKHFGGVALVLVPLMICVAAGSIHASLWLDEIVYWHYERDPELRAAEMQRPGSRLAGYAMNYFYCDIQRAAHAAVGLVGLSIEDDPELYLRFLPLLSFIAAVLLIYGWTFRETRSWWWSVAAALAFSASPLILFYAFEARVTSFATLGVVLYLLLLGDALREPRKWHLLAGALLGIALGHLHAWIVPLFAALCVAGFVRCVITRQWQELRAICAFAVPGGIFATAEALLIKLTYPPGGSAFPLYHANPPWLLLEATFQGMFSASRTRFPAILKPFDLVPSVPLLVLLVALGFVIVELRRSPLVVIPVSAVFALALSIAAGAELGHLVVPRYQVPLFAALFFSLRFAATRNARWWVTAFAALQVMLSPIAIVDIARKGNSREIAMTIDAEAPRTSTAVIVQHPLRLGYPDPLHTPSLHFYLGELHAGRPPLPIYELPFLRDVRGLRGVRHYFGGGPELARAYASTPHAQWQQWLASAPFERLWVVTPLPAISAEARQLVAFRSALFAGGYVIERKHSYRFTGYPPAEVALYVRRSGP